MSPHVELCDLQLEKHPHQCNYARAHVASLEQDSENLRYHAGDYM